MTVSTTVYLINHTICSRKYYTVGSFYSRDTELCSGETEEGVTGSVWDVMWSRWGLKLGGGGLPQEVSLTVRCSSNTLLLLSFEFCSKDLRETTSNICQLTDNIGFLLSVSHFSGPHMWKDQVSSSEIGLNPSSFPSSFPSMTRLPGKA